MIRRAMPTKRSYSSGAQVFNDFFESQFSLTRWQILRHALEKTTTHVAVKNKFADSDYSEMVLAGQGAVRVPQKRKWEGPHLSHGLEIFHLSLRSENSKRKFEPPKPDLSKVVPYYLLDYASIFPVLALDLKPGHSVLDLCAAPGGKSFLISQFLKAPGCVLVCNDVSRSRGSRLKTVLRTHLSNEMLQCTKFLALDGTHIHKILEETFDRILVDAPCSSERHMIHQGETDLWSPKRSKINADRQVKMLLSSFRLLKPGGRLVYSTCSISEIENERVVSRVLHNLRSKGYTLQCLPLTIPLGEKLDSGVLILPDEVPSWSNGGFGPLYVSVLEKGIEDEDAGLKVNEDKQRLL